MTEPRSRSARLDALKGSLAKRRRAEWAFRALGAVSIGVAVFVLAALILAIGARGVTAFTQYELDHTVDLTNPPEGAREDLRLVNFAAPAYEFLFEQFPASRGERALIEILSVGASRELKARVERDPTLLGTAFPVSAPIASDVDLFLKRDDEEITRTSPRLSVSPATRGDAVELAAQANDFRGVISRVQTELRAEADQAEREARIAAVRLASMQARLRRAEAALAALPEDVSPERRREALRKATSNRAAARSLESTVRTGRERAALLRERARDPSDGVELSDQFPSFLVFINGGVVKLTEASGTLARGRVLIPLETYDDADSGAWEIVVLNTPETARLISDQKAAWALTLREEGHLAARFNHRLFLNATSTNPELAGVAGAVVGTLLTIIVTLVVCLPIGVAAAVHLEEFAPKNRLTDFIEVNINNLAAVPSIIFGLLGLAVFLNLFGLPRGSPLAGGLVLALITLPTIIVATRSALRAVPPSVRQASLGLGASKTQTVFGQVLPLAAPGILTGSIIGVAQAIGESAPLLMIGMSAFVADIPDGVTDRATVMPVQIFRWATNPERAFEERTAAAILLLLGLLILINALAVILRRRFEKTW